MKRKILSIILSLAMLLGLLPAVTLPASAADTSISDVAGLRAVTGNGSYKLTADIDLGGEEWMPIENFSGTFDGGGHTISGLNVRSGTDRGLFGRNSGTIKNLKVSGDVTGGTNTGGIVGYNNGGTVQNCTFSGTVKNGSNVGGIVGRNGGTVTGCGNLGTVSGPTTDDGAGGIVGYLDDGTVEKCYNLGTITSTEWYGDAGGIVGYIHNTSDARVSQCYNTGEVTALNKSAGGIVGFIYTEASVVENCYNTGSITSNSTVGGIVGEYWGSVNITVQSCYSTGAVGGNANAKSKGGIIGTIDADSALSVKVQNNFYLNGKGASTGIGSGTWSATGKNESDFKSQNTFSGWSFPAIWTLNTTLGRPILTSNPELARIEYGGEGGTIETTYGTAVIKNLDEYMAYKNNAAQVAGNFTYEITNYGGITGAFIDGSTLTIPVGANAGGYTLTITAKEKEPKFATARSYGTEPVELTVTVTINKATPSYTTPTGLTAVYGQTLAAVDLPDGWKWNDQNTDVGAVGTKTFPATYTPSDTNNYNNATANLSVNVSKYPLSIPAQSFDYNSQSEYTFTVPGVNNETVDVTLTASSADAGIYQYNTTGASGTYTVELNSPNYSVDTAGTLTINQVDQDPPNAGEIKVSKSTDTITVTAPAVEGKTYEYSINDGESWQDENVFTELEAGTTYKVGVRYKKSTNYRASEAVEITVTTLSEEGHATLHPGESMDTGNGTVTNNGNSVTLDDGNGHITTVTPAPQDGVEVDANGNVTVPEGSTVTPPGGPDIEVNDDATVDTGGNVTFPEGGSAQVNGDTVTVPEGGTLTPNGDGGVDVPGGSTVHPGNGGPEMTLPEGGTVDPEGNVKLPGGGSAQVGETTVTVPEDGGTLEPSGEDGVKVPSGSTVTPPGGPDITVNDEATVDTDGSVTLPECGSAKVGDTTVTVPEDGGALEPDGDGGVNVPPGSKVTPPGGPDITVGEQGGTVDKDGNVKLPEGGSAKVGDTTVAVPEGGGTLKPNGDGSVNVPPDSIVTDGEGNEDTVPSQGGKLDSEGNYTANKPNQPSGGSPSTPSTPDPSDPPDTPDPPDAPDTPDTPDPPDVPDTPDTPGGGGGTSGGGSGGGGSGTPTYSPTISKTDGGKVSTSPSNPKRGDTVTVTPTPDEGYEVGNVVVKDRGGSELAVKNNGDGTFSFTQPAGKVTIEVTFKAVSVPPADELDFPALAFSDLDPSAWYWEAVNYVVGSGLMNGYGNGIFAPGDNISRAMLAEILFRLEGSVPVNYLMQYDDVPADTWYTEAVRWATSEGIVSGYGNGKYGPNDPITREQFAVMLYRYEKRNGGGFTGAWMFRLGFTDVADVSEWAYEAMCWCSMNGIVEGKGSGILDPKGKATRAEVAAMLMRYLRLKK